MAPSRQPPAFVTRSRLEGTRLGRKFCTVSIVPVISTPASAATSTAHTPRTRGYIDSTSSVPRGM